MIRLIRIVSIFLVIAFSNVVNAQEKGKLKGAQLEANQYVFEGNKVLTGEKPDILKSEKNYRRAIAKDANNSKARYNLGVSHFATNSAQEAADRFKQAAKLAKTDAEKSAAYYNEGNAHMAMQKPDEAIEAYKNALRNNPLDNDARKNLAIAKKMKQQQDQNKDQQNQDQENKDDNKKEDQNQEDSDNKKEGDSEDKKEEGDDSENDKEGDEDKEKPEGEQEEDSKDSNQDKDDEGGDKDEQQPRQPKEGQLSPDQVKSLLEAMADEEKKVQDKLNAQKVKGAKVKSEKDW